MTSLRFRHIVLALLMAAPMASTAHAGCVTSKENGGWPERVCDACEKATKRLCLQEFDRTLDYASCYKREFPACLASKIRH